MNTYLHTLVSNMCANNYWQKQTREYFLVDNNMVFNSIDPSLTLTRDGHCVDCKRERERER